MNPNLKKLNFKNLLIVDDTVDAETYDFNKYHENGKHLVKGYCLRCEEKGYHVCPTDESYKLTNISHGASTADLLQATDQTDIDFSDWHQQGVLFLMESPSIDGWGLYNEVSYHGYNKRPAKLWYWIHEKQQKRSYPQEFRASRYGLLFNSLVFTFKLKNAYLTNLVKCGLNNQENGYKGIESYNPACISTCFDNFLSKEIEMVSPKVVFCFGTSVLNKLRVLYAGELPFQVIGLPHPAGQRRGFKDEFYKHLYYSMVLEGLYKAGIVTKEQAMIKYAESLS
jgi:hypothetical protein